MSPDPFSIVWLALSGALQPCRSPRMRPKLNTAAAERPLRKETYLGPIPSGPSIPSSGKIYQPASPAFPVTPVTPVPQAHPMPKDISVQERRVCPSCGDLDGSHYESCSSKLPYSEPVRYSVDILEKWATAIAREWGEIHQEMSKRVVNAPRALKISDFAIIDERSFWIITKSAKMTIRDAVSSMSFDTSLLPHIRRLTLEALSECRKKIQAAKDAALKAKLDKEAKLADLPKIIDEFGADIVQFSPDQKIPIPGRPPDQIVRR